MKTLIVVLAFGATVLTALPAAAQCTPRCMNPNDPEADCDGDCCRRLDDCNDMDQAIRGPLCPGGGAFPPGAAPEICDNKDNNCNGSTDEGNPGGGGACTTGQQGVCAPGTLTCSAGSLQCIRNVNPTSETCNGLDDDCDGSVDEGNPGGGGACTTGQQGICAAGTRQCQSGTLTCVRNMNPTTETCNGLDDNCNGAVDEGFMVGQACTVPGQQGRCAMGTYQCQTNGTSACVGPSPVAETCNNIDDNCDGTVDEGNPGGGGACTTGQPGVCAAGTRQCQAGMLNCVRNVGPSMEICDGLDNDCDGVVDNGLIVDADGDGVRACGTCGAPAAPNCDCNDMSAMVRPGATETCNNVDDNCNGQVDEGVTRVCYTGPAGSFTGTCPGTSCMPRGACRGVTQVCTAGAFPTCNMATPGQTFPTAEVCDNVDNNCNGQVDEGLSGAACNTGQLGVCAAGTERCMAGTLQCVRNVNPSAEQCNNLDDNCDGLVDNGVTPRRCFSGPAGTFAGTCPGPTCTPRGQCRAGTQQCDGTGGWLACMGETLPTPEICDGLDNDCNGSVDNGLVVDADNDSSRACNTCGAQDAGLCDCNDNDASIRPGAIELCDTVDQNCNGQLDDVAPRRCFAGPFVTPDTYTGTCPGPMCQPKGACVAGLQACSAAGAWGACVGQVLPANDPAGPEAMCDGRDEDCDGTVDDGNFDVDMDGVKSCEGDCNDGDPAIKPGALEICDGKDNDCDGIVDGVNTGCYSGPANTRGKGICRDGTQQCVNGVGMGPCLGEVVPAALPDGGVPQFIDGGVNDPEALCDNRDEDCDGVVDDGFDLDGDGVTTCAGDCDDRNAFNKPSGREICDCMDNNCNMQTDEGNVCFGAPCHDFDRDGYTNCQGDCDDSPLTGPAVGPNQTERVGDLLDNDCDGAVDEVTDEDGDGFTTAQNDCNDKLASINPGAVEVCDGFDNNCNNQVDEGFDADGDRIPTCAGDCDDMNPLVNPTRREVCGNSVDDNCDGRIDEDTDVDGDGVSTCQGDCNDHNASVHPAWGPVAAAAEVCDGQDNDCDGSFDEGFDQDGDFFASCFGDCDDLNAQVNPNRVEVPANGIDDNCNGLVDEGAEDRDNDGFTGFCGDCNDADPNIHPHATEVCDRVDNNCDAYVDSSPDTPNLCAVCFDADNDGQTNCDGDCNDAERTIYRGAPEICDLKDNDCDGMVDLDPLTGLRVCVSDGGVEEDGGVDAGEDAGTDDAGTGAGGGGGSDVRPVVAVGCGCSSGTELAPLALLTIIGFGSRARRLQGRRAVGRARKARNATGPHGEDGDGDQAGGAARTAPALVATALLATLVLTACGSALTTPPRPDAGAPEEDAGVDAGFTPPEENWPCPGLAPIEHLTVTLPGTLTSFAHSRRYAVTEKAVAKAVLLDDGPQDFAAFVLWRDVPAGVDPADMTALETVAARELASLDALQGSPLVRDRLDRFSGVFVDDRQARTFSTSQELTFAAPTNAFAIRNRLLAALSGVSPGDLGPLPVAAGARAEATLIVNLFFRLTQERFFVGAAVTPQSRLRENLAAMSDLSNGSHLSGNNGKLSYSCEKHTTPALKTDFIFVIDNTVTMVRAQSALQNAAQGLFDALQRSGLDFRLGVVTTDSDVLRGTGFTNRLDEFQANARVGLAGNTTEMGIEYGLRAIQRARAQTIEALKLREDAGLVVLFMSDEENKGLRPLAEYVTAYRMEKAVAFAIVGPRPAGCTRVGYAQAEPAPQYIDLATQTGGSSGSICNPNLSEVIEEIVIGALGASSRSALAKRPISGSLAVRTMMQVARDRVNGFDYEPTSNSVLFFGPSAPTVGADYEAAYAFWSYLD
jgi:hypothetical protein